MTRQCVEAPALVTTRLEPTRANELTRINSLQLTASRSPLLRSNLLRTKYRTPYCHLNDVAHCGQVMKPAPSDGFTQWDSERWRDVASYRSFLTDSFENRLGNTSIFLECNCPVS
jgi:hypothetical protein